MSQPADAVTVIGVPAGRAQAASSAAGKNSGTKLGGHSPAVQVTAYGANPTAVSA